MLRIFARRLASAGISMLAGIAIAFTLLRLAPRGPYDANPKATPEVLTNLRRAFDHDQPIYEQFGRYLWRVLHLDFGPAVRYRDYDVASLVFRGAPITVEIVLWALLAAILIGVPLGSIAARRRGSAIDYSVSAVGMIGLAVPIFAVAPIVQLTFAVVLRWLPIAGWDGGWARKVLPVMVLALPLAAMVMRASRRALPDISASLRRDRLAVRLGAVLSQLGPLSAVAVMASMVVEERFALPGTGRYFVEGLHVRDFTLLAGAAIFYGGAIVLAGLFGDFGRVLIDRRIGIPGAASDGDKPPAATFRSIWAELRQDRAVWLAACVIVAIMLACFLVPSFLPNSPQAENYDAISIAPSWSSGHLLGADDLGRDLLSRVLVGGGNSLLFGAGAALVAAAILFARSMVRVPTLVRRAKWPGDGLLHALPFMILALLVQGEIAPLLPSIVIAAGSLVWLVLGALWHTRRPILLAACLVIPDAILGEAYLGYFGVGAQDPLVTWGSLLADGLPTFDTEPWRLFVPLAALAAALLSLNFLAERARDAAGSE